MEKVLVYDPDKCSGCLYCMVVCAFEHYRVSSLERAHIRIVDDPNQRGQFIAAHCAHCEYPMCEAVCPAEAISKDEKTGIVRIDSMKCIGCKNCRVACPISIPWFDEEYRVSAKCDLCDGDPKCVKLCPTEAITFVSREKARKMHGVLKET